MVVSLTLSNAGSWDSLQCTQTKHDDNAGLLGERELEVDQLRQRYPQHPKIHSNADGGVCPYQSVDVDAVAVMFPVPLRPVVGDWPALEDCNDDEDNTVQDTEYYRGNDDLLNGAPGKYPLVKEQERQLQHRQLSEVADFDPVEVLPECSDLIEAHRPDVPAKAIRYEPSVYQDSAGLADKQSGEDQVIV